MRTSTLSTPATAALLCLAACSASRAAAPTPHPAPIPARTPVQTQPLHGGSYTWTTGITMTVDIEDFGLYGARNDVCGDGSCGVIQPDSRSLGLRYVVSVPDDYVGTFNPSQCPGNLTVVDGVDEDAGGRIEGERTVPLEGPMLPGATKSGVTQQWVTQAYAGHEFLLSSRCGDTMFTGEEALFVGPLG